MLDGNTTEEFKNVIHVETLSKILSSSERDGINNMLHSYNIEIEYHEVGPKASLFEAITVFFNEPLSNMIINGLLTASSYDAIKFVVSNLLSKIKKVYRVSFSSSKNKLIKSKCSNLDLHISNGNINVDVLLSNNYTHKQNLEYLDKVFEKITDLAKKQPPNVQTREFFVIENDEKNPKSLKTMTMLEYAKEQQRKQESKKK
jgi:hypothetical protein